MYKAYKKPFLKIISYLGRKVEKKHFKEPPIYIGGCGRSGTTLVLSIISSHPDVFACPRELDLYEYGMDEKAGRLIPKRIDRLYRTFLTNKIKRSAKRWCEKSPHNINHIHNIESYHNQNYRFINVVRDGRDVILSKHPTNPEQYWVSPDRWITDVKAGINESENPRVLTVRYEDLITNFDEEIKTICSFLHLSLVDEIINWHNHTQVRKNRAYFGDVKPIYSSSIGKWKSQEHKERAMELLNYPEAVDLLNHYNYEL